MSQATRHLSTDAYGREYGSIVDEFGAIPEATEGQVHAARLQCALGGRDAAEVGELLGMLGLSTNPQPVHRPRNRRIRAQPLVKHDG